MAQSAAQTAAFFREIRTDGKVWSIRDGAGFPAPRMPDGNRSMPFWSKRSRAERVIETVAAYRSFEPVQIPVADFRERWLPGLARDGILVGVNWSGTRATGYDLGPEEVLLRLDL